MVPLSAVIAIATALLAVVGSLIVVNLHGIKACINKLVNRVDGQDKVISRLSDRQAACKIDCERQFVKSEVFLRETGFQRRAMEGLTASVNRVEGNLKVVEKLPEISGQIARQVVAEFKNGENK